MRDRKSYAQWVTEWLEKRRPYIKASTYSQYALTVRTHLLPWLGGFALKDITSEKIQEFVCFLERQGKKPQTVKNILSVFLASLTDAIGARHTRVRYLDIPCIKPRADAGVGILTEEECGKLIASVQKAPEPKSLGILMALFTGMRIGEICGLRWRDIDLKGKKVGVFATVQRIAEEKGTRLIITPPKSRTSIREIPLIADFCRLLEPYAVESAEHFFLSGRNTPMEPSGLRKYFYRFLKKNGLRIVKFHTLRHTLATVAIFCGVQCKTVSQILGHSDTMTTWNLYIHPQSKQLRECVEKVADFFKFND